MKFPLVANITIGILLQGFASAAEHRDTSFRGLESRAGEAPASIIRLISNPSSFDGKYVSVGGYLSLDDEYENSLFLDENSSAHGMSANSIAVDLSKSSPEVISRMHELDRHYVLIAGKFHRGRSVFSGGQLTAVYRVIPAD